MFEEREEIYQLLKIENINYYGSVNRSPVYYIFINVDDDIFQQALKMSSIESYLVIIWVTVYIVGVNDRYLFAVTAIFVNMYMLYYYDGGNIWYN